MKAYVLLAASAIGLMSVSNALAKSSFVSQIPNGSVKACANCHVGSNYSSYNSFGQAVNSGYISGGKVTWNANLAKLDSDGDGFTNGTELQDPTGAWKIGAANPGLANSVSNPGDKASVPPTGVLDDNSDMNLSVASISPNPFNNAVSINLNLGEAGVPEISIYDINGTLVKNFTTEYRQASEFSLIWDGTDNSGNKVNSGKYIISMKLGDRIVSKSLELVK